MEEIDYNAKLKEYLLGKLNQHNDPEHGAEDREEMASIRQNDRQNALASSLMKSANQIGTIGGKTADSSPVDNMAQNLARTNQMRLGEIKDRRDQADKQFGINADVYKYLANKQTQDKAAADTAKYRADTLAQGDKNAAASRAQKAAADKLAQERWEKEHALKNKEVEAKLAENAKKNAEKDPSNLSYEQRIAKLNGEERKRFDSAADGYDAVKKMADALLDRNVNTFSVVGDNDYTMYRRKFEEALGRMQSGGAITKDEEERFKNDAPTVWDGSDTQKKKLEELLTQMAFRLKNLGFEPDEVQTKRSEVATKFPDKSGSTAYAGGDSAYMPGSVLEINGKKYRVESDGDTLTEVP